MNSSELKDFEQFEFENPERFSENGFVIVRGVLKQGEIDAIRENGYGEILRHGDVRQLILLE